ncbi:hypothetical protein MNBD_ALPHA09-2294 [hydrothermal vent metagenome]|uniref:MaoC-like domain-containing protein n=1 Tax=hydrothermal vent metagenome TaxID=652676 RepID=A0A3B0TNM9_9ZZZZ
MTGTTTAPPDALLHWEDFPVGETVAFGAYEVTREEITGFAEEFDPQPFHLEDAAANDSLLGGLAASGWHTCAILMRMICDEFLNRSAGLGSPGVDEVKWLKPVRAGNILSVRRTCLEARVSASRPEMGLCKFHYEVRTQTGTVVMTWVVTQLFSRRDAGPRPNASPSGDSGNQRGSAPSGEGGGGPK